MYDIEGISLVDGRSCMLVVDLNGKTVDGRGILGY